MLADGVVEGRLRKAGLVPLVVALAAVADDIDDDVPAEGLAVFDGELDQEDGGDGIVSIDVEDGEAEGLGHRGAVDGGAGVLRQGGEADLVIDDDVDGAAGAVTLQLRQIEGLEDDALAGEGGIAVDEDGEDLPPLDGIVEDPLVGAGLALDDGIDGLEVAGIGGEGDADLVSGGGGLDGVVAEMVLHVAIAVDGLGDVVVGEFVEEELVVLAEDVGEDVEPSAMGHAHDDLGEAEAGARLDDGVEHGDEGLAAFQGKALLADVAGVEERLEFLGAEEIGEDALLFLPGEGGTAPGALDPVPDPAALGEDLHVHVFDADVAAVGVLKDGEDLAQGELAAARQGPGVEDAVEIGLGEVEVLQGELGHLGLVEAEGIEGGEAVAEHPVGEEEIIEAGLLQPDGGGAGVGDGSGAALGGFAVGLARLGLEAELEALEEGAPGGVDRIGVELPLFVVVLEEGGVFGGADAAPGVGASGLTVLAVGRLASEALGGGRGGKTHSGRS